MVEGGRDRAISGELEVEIIDPATSPIDRSDWDLRPSDQWALAELTTTLKAR